MSKKDYILLADALRDAKPRGDLWEATSGMNQWDRDVDAISLALASDNPRFSAERFRAWCEK